MSKKKLAEPAAPEMTKIGAEISNVTINNSAASVSDKAADALNLAAQAALANAKAIEQIATSLKGAEAHMTTGISLSNIRADDAA